MLAIAILAVLGVLAYVLIANPGAEAKQSSEAPQHPTTTPAQKPEQGQLGVKAGSSEDVATFPGPPAPAPLVTGTPGTPVELGNIRVTVKDSAFRAVGTSSGAGQCVTVEATGLENDAHVSQYEFWLTSDTNQNAPTESAYADDPLEGIYLTVGQSVTGSVCFSEQAAGNGRKILTLTHKDFFDVEYNAQWDLSVGKN